MNASSRNSLDDRLSAWLDNELLPEQQVEVTEWLRDHPDDAARVRLWAADRDAIRARLESGLAEPVPTRLEQVVWSQAPAVASNGWQRLAVAAAVFVLGIALGAGAMWRWHAPDRTADAASPGRAWVQRAALAHSVYVPEQRHPVEVAVAGKTAEDSRAQEEHLTRWLTRRLDVPVKLFDLRAQGFELVGGRLLPDAAGPSAQLMYQHKDTSAVRVTVYLRRPDRETPAAFRYEQQGALGMFYWVDGPAGYALVGSLPRAQLLTLAQAIHAQCQTPN